MFMYLFKVVIKVKNEMIDEEITNLFNFTLKNNASNCCNSYMRDHPNYRFTNLEQVFCRCYQTIYNNELWYS
jgi:hypothetical protein